MAETSSNIDLSGTKIVVTGSSSGIGLAMAEGLLLPEVMVETIIFLASSKSDDITGERITAIEFSEWLVKTFS